MTPAEIKMEMQKKGVLQTELARNIGVSQPTIHHIIYKRSVSARVMKALADSIGKDVRDVFPERFKKAS